MHPTEYELCIRLLKIYAFYSTYCVMAFANLHVFGNRKFFDFPYSLLEACTLDPLPVFSYRYVQVVPGKTIVPGF